MVTSEKMFRNIKVIYATIQMDIPIYIRYLVTLSGANIRRYSSRSDNLRQSMVGGKVMLVYLPHCDLSVRYLPEKDSCLLT